MRGKPGHRPHAAGILGGPFRDHRAGRHRGDDVGPYPREGAGLRHLHAQCPDGRHRVPGAGGEWVRAFRLPKLRRGLRRAQDPPGRGFHPGARRPLRPDPHEPRNDPGLGPGGASHTLLLPSPNQHLRSRRHPQQLRPEPLCPHGRERRKDRPVRQGRGAPEPALRGRRHRARQARHRPPERGHAQPGRPAGRLVHGRGNGRGPGMREPGDGRVCTADDRPCAPSLQAHPGIPVHLQPGKEDRADCASPLQHRRRKAGLPGFCLYAP